MISRAVRLVFLITLFIPAGVAAQNYLASVRGMVTGPTGDPLSGATLTLTREETGETREAATGADGEFTIVPVAGLSWLSRKSRRPSRGKPSSDARAICTGLSARLPGVRLVRPLP